MNSDPVITGVVTAAALQVAKQGQDFIAAAAGRPGLSIGTILGEWAQRRVKNAEAIGNKAHLILLNLDLKPKEAPFNVIQPLLESATLQDDPSLQETWANLLANAADPRRERPLNAIFPYILRDLGLVTAPIHDADFEVQQRPDYAASQDTYFLTLDLIRNHNVIRETILPRDAVVPGFEKEPRVYHFGELGAAFVLTCRPPAKNH